MQVHNIGCLSLETGPLKHSLRTEASVWKTMYTSNLHTEVHRELCAKLAYMADLEIRLDQDLNELDDARQMMTILKVYICVCVCACLSLPPPLSSPLICFR